MTPDASPTEPGWDPEREEAEAEANPDRGSRRWWLIGGVAVVAAVAMSIWYGLSMTSGAITTTDVGFERNGEREIVMVFDVTRPTGTALSCTVTAMDSTYGRVGTKEQAVPASDERTTRVRAAVRTTTRAVTATVADCTVVD
ncbi:DUF4307 domain-containing protein [Janibacter hoylei]|uniref:DUF4307 domain-containing protein n=1 Tax=Janibacter hoylei PVAS-1 TaxID=1210046 RepID=K1E6G7_9MICO|nr:DUF4307 domain-containing protein [Janibacter hoylei]EKA62666.1 hypothetical protein B277_00560 [Janibacter hoylei PVAS-1]MCW4601175.1 DUF4307 domain-containing protein [Janibacter hoylei]RWU84755.1 DUF4307 domain-containing protein [Janibacter hoylei PVAS-1]